jgi:hypothetical protein
MCLHRSRPGWPAALRRIRWQTRSQISEGSNIEWNWSLKFAASHSITTRKATSVDATLKALEALGDNEGKTILILGGRGKNAPYAPLADLIEKNVRKLIVLGEDADKIESQLKPYAEIVRVGSIAEAAVVGFDSAEPGDAVLLAPACASFDMFKSFEERGEVFKAAVEELKREKGAQTSSISL